jgi:hypothetical protein
MNSRERKYDVGSAVGAIIVALNIIALLLTVRPFHGWIWWTDVPTAIATDNTYYALIAAGWFLGMASAWLVVALLRKTEDDE